MAEIIENVGMVYRLLYQSLISDRQHGVLCDTYSEVPVVVQYTLLLKLRELGTCN